MPARSSRDAGRTSCERCRPWTPRRSPRSRLRLQLQQKPAAERAGLALTAAEAIAQAAAEGLPLVRLPGTPSGFKGVHMDGHTRGCPLPSHAGTSVGVLRYSAILGTAKIHLGNYGTAEEAALHYARCLGRAKALAEVEAVDAVSAAPAFSSAEEVLTQAAKEGLELICSERCASGYVGVVTQRNGWFGAQHADSRSRTTTWLGNYRLKEEAALAYARFKAGRSLAYHATSQSSALCSARRSIAAMRGAQIQAEKRKLREQEEEQGEEACAALSLRPDDATAAAPAPHNSGKRHAAVQATASLSAWCQEEQQQEREHKSERRVKAQAHAAVNARTGKRQVTARARATVRAAEDGAWGTVVEDEEPLPLVVEAFADEEDEEEDGLWDGREVHGMRSGRECDAPIFVEAVKVDELDEEADLLVEVASVVVA